MISVTEVEKILNKAKDSVSDTGTFTGTLPSSIPAEPKNFAANVVNIDFTGDTGMVSGVSNQHSSGNNAFIFTVPHGLKTGTHLIVNDLSPKTVGASFTRFFSGDDYQIYVGVTGALVVTQISQSHMVATFNFKTVGGKQFSGAFNIREG
ncbi:hypothetical protein [Pseudomonas izuensis]|uniref:C1q domain-containing protein n=1 Tax=Pseudomonas izuensis TaxID=2684212 RepID=A0ABM7RRM4_9PSED|nr:hypothetical protein [Pseudomonas izuensis]BCX68075.1 hypothetical protein LAB08_R27150 [Pseudomonas izuensis]